MTLSKLEIRVLRQLADSQASQSSPLKTLRRLKEKGLAGIEFYPIGKYPAGYSISDKGRAVLAEMEVV